MEGGKGTIVVTDACWRVRVAAVKTQGKFNALLEQERDYLVLSATVGKLGNEIRRYVHVVA